MPLFRFDKALDIARNAKAFLNPTDGVTPDARKYEGQAESAKVLTRKLKDKKMELSQIKEELGAAKRPKERRQHKKRKKRVQQEIFLIERELRFAKKQAIGGPGTGALPDFVVIGTMKGGTTFLYHLLTQHPLVEPAASKELHFFDLVFDQGVEWYRRCFPLPEQRNGRRTITGEATPYLAYPSVPERMAQVIPQAKLIALLRNPVDRAYSEYQQVVRKGRETRTFEEALADSKYLSKGIYVDQLQRWFEFFSDEQMLVLKSEDFFEDPVKTLKVVLKFLDLPDWEPNASELMPSKEDKERDRSGFKKQNKGKYKQGMDPKTRRRLEEYFEPHNKRLYEYLDVDFGW